MQEGFGDMPPSKTYPEVNIQPARASKFPVANLEGYRHLVVLVERLVEAFFGMRTDVNVVGRSDSRQGQQERREEPHDGGREYGDGGDVRSNSILPVVPLSPGAWRSLSGPPASREYRLPNEAQCLPPTFKLQHRFEMTFFFCNITLFLSADETGDTRLKA